MTPSVTLVGFAIGVGKPFLLHEEETFPEASELLEPEMAGDDWPGPAWGEIWCQREDDGSWSIWYLSLEDGKEPEELERVRGLRTPAAFWAAYHDCGVDYGCHPDGTELMDELDFLEVEDPALARAFREWNESKE